MGKPREFWICSPDANAVGIDNKAVVWHREPHKSAQESYPIFHVIEKSAADKLAEALDAIRLSEETGKKTIQARVQADKALADYRGEK